MLSIVFFVGFTVVAAATAEPSAAATEPIRGFEPSEAATEEDFTEMSRLFTGGTCRCDSFRGNCEFGKRGGSSIGRNGCRTGYQPTCGGVSDVCYCLCKPVPGALGQKNTRVTTEHDSLSPRYHYSPHLHGHKGCFCNGAYDYYGDGECQTKYEGRFFCYVDGGSCSDAQWFYGDFYWSYEACNIAPTDPAISCCSTDSWAQLETTNYVAKGSVQWMGDMEIYVVGNGERCVIWNHDIYGFNSGRSRQLADLLAEAGFMVLMPDYFKGAHYINEFDNFISDHTQWSNLKADWEYKIHPLAKQLGAKKISAVGTCWGSYMVLRLSALPEVSCGVSMHPAHPLWIQNVLREDERALLQQVRNNNCPQLFMAAGGDSPNVKKGGLADQVLGEKAEFELFAEMKHGWTTRGDETKEAVLRDVKKAVTLAIEFLNEHM